MSLRIIFTICVILAMGNITTAQTDKPDQAAKPKRNAAAAVANRLSKKQKYELKYKLKPGDVLEWKVEQVVSTQVRMAGEEDKSSSRAQTTKRWVVKSVDSLGQMTFVLKMVSANMWQQTGDAEPVLYDSTKDDTVPDEYVGIAEKVGQALAVFTIRPDGHVVSRRSEVNESNFGTGDITLPLPDQAIPIGFRWNVPSVLNATDEAGVNRKLKARISYELARVKGKYAFVKFRTEVLTPVKSQKIKSTIMQQMTDGYVVFDMQGGYPAQKQVQWDEKAQGFEGADSLLTYVGRMSEKISAKRAAKQTVAGGLNPLAKQVKQVKLRTQDGQPLTKK